MTLLALAGLLLAGPLLEGQGTPAAFNQSEWNRATRLLKEGKPDEALETFKRALGQKPDRNRLAQAGRMLFEAQELSGALSLYRWGRKAIGQEDLFSLELGAIYQLQLKYPEAVSEFALALKGQPDMAESRFRELALSAGYKTVAQLAEGRVQERGDRGRWLMADLWRQAGDSRRAWSHARMIGDRKMLSQAFSRLLEGMEYDRAGAIALTEDYLKMSPADSLGLLIRLSDMYLEVRQYGKAEAVLARLAGRGQAEAQYRLARLWLDVKGRSDKAGEIVREGLPNWPPGLRAEGELLTCRCLMAERRWEEAASRCSLQLAKAQGPEARQRAYFLWGEIYLAEGSLDRALAHYGQSVRALEDGDLANEALARILLISQTKTDKIQTLGLLSRAVAAKYGTDRELAKRIFSALADSAPGTMAGDLALEEMAGLSLGEGKHRQAMGYLGRLAETTADSLTAARAYHQMGALALDYERDSRMAAAKWEQGILRYPNTSWAELMRQALESLKTGNTP